MEISFYEQEMKRLKDQWPNAYSKERMIIFYNAFRSVSNFDFKDAVDYCLGNSKGAPLLPELNEAISKVITARKHREKVEAFNPIKEMLNSQNYVGDPVFMLKCNELRFKAETKQISQKEFHREMDKLDKEAAEICKKKGVYRNVNEEIEALIRELNPKDKFDSKPF